MQLPSVKQMQYLVAVNETLHFGKAAETCFVSQSALSTGIRELENMLGVKLFERSRKQITTTPIGEALGEQARHCLKEIATLVELAQSNNKPMSGPVRLGIIPTITPFMLPSLLPALRTEFPDMDFFLCEGLSADIYAQLQNGELDLLLLAMPYELPKTDSRVLFGDPLLLAYHENTSLIAPESWTPEEGSLEMLMLLEEGHCLRDHAIDGLSKRKRQAINPFIASSLSTLIHMVGSDLGFTFLPHMATDSPIVQHSAIQLRELTGQNSREIALVWREGSTRASDFNAIAEHVISLHQSS